MADPVRKIKQITQLEHAKLKSMWVGSKDLQTQETYIFDGELQKFVYTTIKYTPAWLKIIDEVLVNAIDHWTVFSKKVTNINIDFNIKDGTIKITNNGPSIEIYEVENINGVKMYTPQMIASEFQSGDNLDDNVERITGGTNGAGLKLTNAFSKFLFLATYNKKKKIYYTQRFEERLTKILPPDIEKKCEDFSEDFTSIFFMPDYKALGYETGYNQTIGADLYKLIHSRAVQAKAFVGPKCDIIFNKKKIIFGGGLLKDFTQLFPVHGDVVSFKFESKQDKYPMDVCIGLSDGKFEQVSIINGIWVCHGGSHIKKIQNDILEALVPKAEKEIKKTKLKFNKNYIINNLFIFVKAYIINPTFKGQVKEAVDDPIEKFQNYKISNSVLNKIWELVKPAVLAHFFEKYAPKAKTTITRGKIDLKKGYDAKYAGHKTKWKETTLFVCEGDSALGTVDKGILSKETKLSYDYFGTYSIQGVPINARKECVESKDPKNKNVMILTQSEKLKKSDRFINLVKLLGLDYTKSYESDAEFNTLRYGRVVAAVDQDVDGKGNIFGLLLNYLILFWPHLIKRGYLCRFNTPIIRAYAKKKTQPNMEFFSVCEFKEWKDKKYKENEAQLLEQYEIEYYKGLGTHSTNETVNMFQNFDKKVYIYTLDKDALKNIEIYFGKDTALRKKVLATPVIEQKIIGQHVEVSIVLHTDIKEYQRDNIIRKLPSIMDGMVPARRKVLFGAMNIFKQSNRPIKVAIFSNDVAKRTEYHHAVESMYKTVSNMAQNFPGSNNLPLLLDFGNFGSRKGDPPASARYIKTALNKELCQWLYPEKDNFLLPYVFEDGKRVEPEYYVPILPTAIMESMEIPATGWKCKIWARDYKQIINATRDMINNKIKTCPKLEVWKNRYTGDIIDVKGKQYSYGKYHYDKKNDALVITELPMGIFSSNFIQSVCYTKEKLKSEFREPARDETTTTINIQLFLNSGVYANLIKKSTTEEDGVIKFLKLKGSMESNLNLIDENGVVIEFKDYESIFNHWFKVRKNLYADRIDREIILTKLRIIYWENIVRFCEHHIEYNIKSNMTLEMVYDILHKNNYTKINHTLLLNPKYTKVSELENSILENGTYDYLTNLKYSDLTKASYLKKKEKLQENKNLLKELKKDLGSITFPKGGLTWLKELDALEKIIDKALVEGWNPSTTDTLKFTTA